MDAVIEEQPVELDATAFKSEVKPIWCPGCGDFGVLSALTRALSALARPPHEIAVVSGIGCSSRLPAYTTAFGIHSLHGRALPLATGLKLARPDLEVIVVGGDGDGYSIGGNHFLHACRRNVDMLYVVMDNRVYGMTKGQPSPTTEPGWTSALSPQGTDVAPLSPLAIAISAGAGFVARGFSGDPNGLAKLMVEGIQWAGFALIEVMSPCVTFRPEQRRWKDAIHVGPEKPYPDPASAAAALLADDGFGVGVYYRGQRPMPPERSLPVRTLAQIEQEFRL
ncbi:MAG: 2-oxoacid:ferredoxin oxidoreductase subunit beta [Burkholderiales bacterium]|nr:MAG: 2-oxoacid:ferredoxin oxidoreductase subunit beta [Burkholderiales bacterium]